MEKDFYLIKEVAKEVQVETHVLRYWEEELGLHITRNNKGHRLYSKNDVMQLIRVKKLKDEGLQLKAVKKLLCQEIRDEKNAMKIQESDPKVINFHMKEDAIESEQEEDSAVTVSKIVAGTLKQKDTLPRMAIEIKDKVQTVESREKQQDHTQEEVLSSIVEPEGMLQVKGNKREEVETVDTEKAKKAMRLQVLFQNMIQDAVMANQEQVMRAMKENIAKEFDFQFRQLEELQEERDIKLLEREEERERVRREREEQHYKEIDALLRKTVTKTKRKKLSKD